MRSPVGQPDTHASPRVDLGGIPILDATPAEALARCRALLANGGGRIATANLDFLALARRNPQLRDDLRASTYVIADGAPVAWLGRLAGGKSVGRLAGVDLVAGLLTAAPAGSRVVLYGSTPDVASAAASRLEGLGAARVVLAISPPFRPLTAAEVVAYREAIAAARPDLVLVALGCPRQERVIAEWHELAPGALWIGIGGTLDFFVGRRARAPRWAQQTGLEWVVRLAQEPGRLWRRYLLRDVPEFVRLLPAALLGRHVAKAKRAERPPNPQSTTDQHPANKLPAGGAE